MKQHPTAQTRDPRFQALFEEPGGGGAPVIIRGVDIRKEYRMGDVTVTDVMPAGLTYVAGSAAIIPGSRRITFTFGW